MITEWKVQSKKRVFGKYGRNIDEIMYEMPNGAIVDFYIKAEGHAVVVLALTDDHKVVLAKQYRPGPEKIVTEMPGGGIDEGEEPKVAAVRELLEETGYQSREVTFVASVMKDAYSTMNCEVFVATGCCKIAEPLITETEVTEVVLLSIDDFRDHLRTGQLSDTAAGYLALDYLKLL
ncbi:NUDIX hydrolase [bacterium]|nr:MAG: NUDIX hydrolase [bacterium]